MLLVISFIRHRLKHWRRVASICLPNALCVIQSYPQELAGMVASYSRFYSKIHGWQLHVTFPRVDSDHSMFHTACAPGTAIYTRGLQPCLQPVSLHMAHNPSSTLSG